MKEILLWMKIKITKVKINLINLEANTINLKILQLLSLLSIALVSTTLTRYWLRAKINKILLLIKSIKSLTKSTLI